MTCMLFAVVFAAVNFTECPKCDKRIRISADGREAFVNTSRIEPGRRQEMKARAEMLLGMAEPVRAANPDTPRACRPRFSLAVPR